MEGISDDARKGPRRGRRVYARPPEHLVGKPIEEMTDAERAELEDWIARFAERLRDAASGNDSGTED